MSVTPKQVSVVWVYADNFAKHECDELILAGTVYDPASRQDTLVRVAKAWGR